MPGVDINYFIRQANKLTEKIEQRKKELADETLEGRAGDGLVTAVANGIQEIKSIKIDPKAIDPAEPPGGAAGQAPRCGRKDGPAPRLPHPARTARLRAGAVRRHPGGGGEGAVVGPMLLAHRSGAMRVLPGRAPG